MYTKTITPDELEADRKQVYKCGNITLVELARKYGVKSRQMQFIDAEPERADAYANIGFAMCPSKSDRSELERMVYAAIKTRQAQA